MISSKTDMKSPDPLVELWDELESGKVAATSGHSDGGADASSPAPTPGSERGPCYPNSTCNAGLECLSDLCVKAPGGGGPWRSGP